MRIEVRLFAALRDAVGDSVLAMDLPERSTAGEVRETLARLHPRHAALVRSCRLAIGLDFVEDDRPLTDRTEVVLIPPVSGGLEPPAARLTGEPLDGALLEAAANRPHAGAVVVFEGTVRSPSAGKDVLWLEYEAYEAMALAGMERIVDEARERWPLAAAYLHHRLGRIEVGEASVVAVVSAVHRAEAFEACRHLIERLKADVPIWKKEIFADGSVWVGAPGECNHPGEAAPGGSPG